MATIHHLHRVVNVPLRTLDDIARESGVEAQVRELPDIRRTRHVVIRPTLRDDFRDFVSEVRSSPESHALVAILTIAGWTLLLCLPFLIGGGK